MSEDKLINSFFEASNIKKIYCFHIDHFEPTTLDNNHIIKDGIINKFINSMNSHNHSKKMSIFYRPTFSVGINESKITESHSMVEGDFVSFNSDKNTIKSGGILSRLSEKTEFEFNLHIHHEHFTFSDDMSKERKILYIENGNDHKADFERLSLYIDICKRFMLKNSKFRADGGWFFVHGKWALNGSDLRVCRMEEEISLLRSHGCVGDFSFPAGRRNCDPYIKTPFTIKPIRCARSYDYAASEAMAVYSGSNVMTDSRFFIWNSNLTHPSSSLDNFSHVVGNNLANHDSCLYNLLNGSVRINDMLFVKTYAHSLEKNFVGGTSVQFPLEYPNVVRMFAKLEFLCNKNNVELNYVTAGEVYNIFKGIDNGTIE